MPRMSYLYILMASSFTFFRSLFKSSSQQTCLSTLFNFSNPYLLPTTFTQASSLINTNSADLFSSVAQLRLTLCDPMDCSTPGFPIHYQLLQLVQTHTTPFFLCIFYLPNVLKYLFCWLSAFSTRTESLHGKELFLCFTPPCVWQLCTVPRACAQSRLTLCDPMDCSLPGSSVHGIFSARILEWVAISSSRGSSWPRTEPSSAALAGRFFTTSATWEAPPRVYRIIAVQWENGELWCQVFCICW